MMIQRIGYMPYRARTINFKGDDTYALQDANVKARQAIREHLESKFDSTYDYLNEFNSKTFDQIRAEYGYLTKTNACEVIDLSSSKSRETVVDERKMTQKLGGSYCNVKRKNELYSGPVLERVKDGIQTAKLAGFKTILALERDNDSEYASKCRREGLKFIGLKNIGNGSLHVFSIIHTQFKPDALFTLIEHPEEWATMNKDGTKKEHIDKNVSDFQDFIDIMDGKNEDYPLPMYFGCMLGSNRTFYWNMFYNMLKNQDRTEPLRKEVVNQLIEFDRDTQDCYR